MNKKMREILQQINAKREDVKALKTEAKSYTGNNNIANASKKIEQIKNLETQIDELLNDFNNAENNFKLEKEGAKNIMSPKSKTTCSRVISNSIYPNEKITSTVKASKSDIDFGCLVKGMVGKGWDNAPKEKEYYNMNSTGGKVLIPLITSSEIIDVAREQSAIFGKIPTIPMDHNNMRIAIQTKDAEANFVAEGDLIPSSEALFDSVDLEGKTMAIYIPITEQLLESSNLTEQLSQSTARAIVCALDKALIYGQGENSIVGLNNIEGVKKINHSTTDYNYDFVIEGARAIKKANIIPTNVSYNSDLASDIEKAKTTDGQYLEKPKFMDKYIESESNNLQENHAIIYNMDSLLIGIHKDITIEWGYSTDDFQRLKKGLRIHLRADFVPVRKDGVALININKTA